MGQHRGRDGSCIGQVTDGVVAWPYTAHLTARGRTPLERVGVCPEGTEWSQGARSVGLFRLPTRPISRCGPKMIVLQFVDAARSVPSLASSPLRSGGPPEHNLGEVGSLLAAAFTAFPRPLTSPLLPPPLAFSARRGPRPVATKGARP